MDYVLLATELENDPTGAGYASMTSAEIAASLNALSEPTRQRVPIERLQAAAMETGVYASLRTAVATPETPPQLVALCQTALDLANARFADVDLDNPAAIQMFGALHQYRVISAEQAATIDALATVPGRSRAAELGLDVVSEADVQAAQEWQIAQEAEITRLTAFAALRERLVSGYGGALAWLQSQEAAGSTAPTWNNVLARM